MTKQPLILKSGEGETVHAIGAKVTFLCQGRGDWSLVHLRAPLRGGPPAHEHDFDEAYYVLSGSIRMTVGGEELLLDAGDFIHVPGGTIHGFQGASDPPAQLLIFQAPGDAGDFFRDVAREVTNIPADLPRIPEIGARHGIRFPASSCHAPKP